MLNFKTQKQMNALEMMKQLESKRLNKDIITVGDNMICHSIEIDDSNSDEYDEARIRNEVYDYRVRKELKGERFISDEGIVYVNELGTLICLLQTYKIIGEKLIPCLRFSYENTVSVIEDMKNDDVLVALLF